MKCSFRLNIFLGISFEWALEWFVEWGKTTYFSYADMQIYKHIHTLMLVLTSTSCGKIRIYKIDRLIYEQTLNWPFKSNNLELEHTLVRSTKKKRFSFIDCWAVRRKKHLIFYDCHIHCFWATLTTCLFVQTFAYHTKGDIVIHSVSMVHNHSICSIWWRAEAHLSSLATVKKIFSFILS